MKKNWRTIVIVALLIFAFTLGEDHRSCLRQIPLRREFATREEVLKEFLETAYSARIDSAIQESKKGNNNQAAIDFKTAEQYREERDRLHHVPIPDCNRIFPSL